MPEETKEKQFGRGGKLLKRLLPLLRGKKTFPLLLFDFPLVFCPHVFPNPYWGETTQIC